MPFSCRLRKHMKTFYLSRWRSVCGNKNSRLYSFIYFIELYCPPFFTFYSRLTQDCFTLIIVIHKIWHLSTNWFINSQVWEYVVLKCLKLFLSLENYFISMYSFMILNKKMLLMWNIRFFSRKKYKMVKKWHCL